MDLRKNEKVIIEGSVVTIDTFYAFGHRVEGAVFDLSQPECDKYRGKILRVWVDNDHKLTTERLPSQVWLLVEIPVPKRQFKEVETEEFDEDENPIIERVEIPMVINETECNIYELPPAK